MAEAHELSAISKSDCDVCDRAALLFCSRAAADVLPATFLEKGTLQRSLDELHGSGEHRADVLRRRRRAVLDGALTSGDGRLLDWRLAILRAAQFRADLLGAQKVLELLGCRDGRQFLLSPPQGFSVVDGEHWPASHSPSRQSHSQLPSSRVLRRESRNALGQSRDAA